MLQGVDTAQLMLFSGLPFCRQASHDEAAEKSLSGDHCGGRGRHFPWGNAGPREGFPETAQGVHQVCYPVRSG